MTWPDTDHLPPGAFDLPREPVPAVLQVLRLLPMHSRPISQVLQRAGFSVPRLPEDEHAHALLYLLPFAIAYGDNWWPIAREHLALMDPERLQH